MMLEADFQPWKPSDNWNSQLKVREKIGYDEQFNTKFDFPAQTRTRYRQHHMPTDLYSVYLIRFIPDCTESQMYRN